MDFRKELIHRYWKYQRTNFADYSDFFDTTDITESRPPVFVKETEWENILISPNADKNEINALLNLIPLSERHKGFGSFNSSQVLALSILGNLIIDNKIYLLNDVTDEEYNESLLDRVFPFDLKAILEYKVNYLNEPTPTSLDCFIQGDYNIAIECKFIEENIGLCSMPKLNENNSKYQSDYCNGSYTIQGIRKSRCTLSEKEIKYWHYIPELFNWRNDIDSTPCPLNSTYQLVRNILAACVDPESGKCNENNGHALLLYDERNPSFQDGGKASNAYALTKAGLKNKRLLRKCSWQRIVKYLRGRQEFYWLTKEFEMKYGM